MNETNIAFSAVYHLFMFTVEFVYPRTRSRKTWIRQQMVRGAAPLPSVSPAIALIHHWSPLSQPLPPASTPPLRNYLRGWWLIKHLFSRQKQNLYAYKVSYAIFMWYSDNRLCQFLKKIANLRLVIFSDRKSMGLRHSDTAVSDTATRSGRLLQKYRVSATTALARKKARVAMLSSIRPKQKLSRILQR